MKELYKQACFTKSFYMLGNSLNKCLNCSYCRLIGETNKSIVFDKIPSEVNEMFTDLPVAVNLFYGDPLIQTKETITYLRKLENAKHKGPVIIITKGDFSKFPKLNFNLDLHFAFSTFGINSQFDGGSLETFENNLKLIQNSKFKYSIEYRPVIKDINDSKEIIENIYQIADKYNAPIAFCGLQVNDDLKKYFQDNNINFEPYNGYEFGLKKSVSMEVEDIFL